ncbi:NYN domain-containing protein [Phytomonospora sp. NPDC050363]|uniref:NYN domain-containing protein n=1 Tax=Phytomonospora sp. NPDC050363 TaxID=3155642 RepID=UPI0033D35154
MVSRVLRAWPAWSGYAAAAWSLLYGLAGLYWSLGGAAYPYAAEVEDLSAGSVLEPSRAEVVGPFIAAVGAVGAICGVLAARRWGSGVSRRVLLGLAWAQAVAFTALIPDYTIIALIAFAPALLVFAFTGVPGPQEGIGDIIYWHRGNLIIVFIGGLLWALAALSYQRRTRHACERCGRDDRPASHLTSPASAMRWGRWAVWIALAATIPYDLTRLAWYFGYPLGITPEFLTDMQNTPGMLEMGLALGVASGIGSVLSHGLVARWGEVWPRWVPFKAGRRIHPATVIIPAATVSIALVPGGMMGFHQLTSWETWGVVGPVLLWAVWGLALGAATLGYHLRRRGRCHACGRGSTPVERLVQAA